MKRGTIGKILITLLLGLLLQGSVLAANETISVASNQSRLITIYGVERVAVANPEIADVLVVSGSELLVVGKQPGVTSLHIWSAAGRSSYDVVVGTNDIQIAGDIKSILGYSDIRVSKVGKNIILEGSVSDQYQKMRAEKVASAYGEKVVNLLEITRPVQVKIEARIIEINRSKTDNLGLKWGNDTSSPGSFHFGQSPQSQWKVTYGNDGGSYNVWNSAQIDSKLFGKAWGGYGGYWDINAQLDALVKQGLAKILSQPNIITLSGEKADILVGGQIPIPVAFTNGAISVEWKEYGIKLEIQPEVSGEGLIVSKIKAEVSTLDWSSDHQIGISQNFKIPPINARKAEASLALASGQTMALGGLIANEITKDITKIPGLANLPVLGKLFTSTSFTNHETELVILITPTIVNPADYIPSMTKEMKDFSKDNPYSDKDKIETEKAKMKAEQERLKAEKDKAKATGGKSNGGKN